MLNVQGQDRAIAHLQRAMNSGRLAHTWIFAGPTGVGKFKTAIELAKTVMCDRPVTRANGDSLSPLPAEFQLKLACGACESCKAVDAGSHPDLHIVTKELIRYHDRAGTSKGTTLSIKVIRGEITGSNDPDNQVEAKIYKRSFRGRGKFFIIDEADLMELPAQNSLLKTLEEPPAESYLIMITASAGELLSTIRSRSQIVTFAELSEEIIVPALIGRGVNAEDAQILARLSRGSLGRTLRWAGDIHVIADKNAKAEARKKDDDDDKAPRFTPGGILAWSRQLAEALDALAIGRGAASEVSAVIAKFASEFAELELVRDKLTSEAEARRRGTALLLAIAAEWFAERMRRGLGATNGAALPGETASIDYGIAPKLIASARRAEAQIEMNVNEKILLAATTTEWESLLRAG